jgi:DNA-dependent RNA polymerase auxiliary subunit epsilon
MIALLIVLVIALIGFSVWNLFSLKDLKKYNRSKQEIKDDRYYELKYKIEYVTIIAIVVFSVGAFFGYKWFEEIKKDASENLKEKTDSLYSEIESLRTSIKPLRDSVTGYKNIVNKLNLDQKDVGNNIQYSREELSNLKSEIKTISNKSIVKQDFYIVDNLKFSVSDANFKARFYYKDLTTIIGDKLPLFNKAPFLVAVPENPAILTILQIEKDYFDIESGSSSGPVDSAKFGIMISQK